MCLVEIWFCQKLKLWYFSVCLIVNWCSYLEGQIMRSRTTGTQEWSGGSAKAFLSILQTSIPVITNHTHSPRHRPSQPHPPPPPPPSCSSFRRTSATTRETPQCTYTTPTSTCPICSSPSRVPTTGLFTCPITTTTTTTNSITLQQPFRVLTTRALLLLHTAPMLIPFKDIPFLLMLPRLTGPILPSLSLILLLMLRLVLALTTT